MSARGLRIGLVGPLPPPSGGMANQTLQLAKLLRDDGATVSIIQVNPDYSPEWIKDIRGVRALFRLISYVRGLFRASKTVDLFHIMANSGWSWHLFAAPAIWVARLSGKPVIVNYRGGEADEFLKNSLFWVKPSLSSADLIIVPSGYLKSVFNKYGFVAEIVPNIINLDRFTPLAKCATAETDAPCILVSRNLEPIYDNSTVLFAPQLVRKSYPTARLIIAGAGPERDALEQTAHELGIAEAVTFTGRVDNADMAALYHKANIVVNPSLVDNMPNSLLEALASGVPIVSTNVGGVPYMVEHEKTALLIPPKSPLAMAAAIESLLSNYEKAQQLRDAGLDLVQQYTWPAVRSQLLDYYGVSLSKRNKAALSAL